MKLSRVAHSVGLAIALLAPGLARAEVRAWVLTTDLWGNPSHQSLHLQDDGGQLSGDLDGDALAGRRSGDDLAFTVTDKSGALYRFNGRLAGGSMTGTADLPDTNNKDRRAVHAFHGRRIETRPPGPSRQIEFQARVYANTFSAEREPVLTIWPGDTVHTRTPDSGGVDETGATVALFGNPQVGPFFVAGAEPGDTLVVHLRRLRLNRSWADSLDAIVGRAMTSRLAGRANGLGKPVRWNLDLQRGLARPEGATGALRSLALPVRPMLGGLAVAPGFGSPPQSTGDTGPNGGNMDFPEVAEGAAVLLPVQQPGALLYLGDAHAMQGDGETSQFALETSMDVEFSVEVIKAKSIPMPRLETATQIMVLGQAGSIDDALRAATSGMTLWLEADYGLTLSESAQLLGSSAHYAVVNLAGRSVGVALKLDKSVLAQLARSAPAG